ncbi:MAG: amidinotransferase [Deltaproteobacteria bacterium]|nr:MAG: amidinotransferase [Deltaproteobacteria bacterium]
MSTSNVPARALLRLPSSEFQDALVGGVRAPVDIPLLESQHRGIVEGLAWCGLRTTVLAPLAGAPDACFVEDRAVVLGERAVITRSAVPTRAPEAESVREALGAWCEIVPMDRGHVDGGDVLRIGDALWVGRSERTDDEGAAFLAEVAADQGLRLVRIDVEGLHLKCVCSAPAPGVLLFAEGYGLEAHVPSGVRAIAVPNEEAYAANAVGANGRVLVAAGYPVTARRLADAGLEVRKLDNSEFAKRDGSLTCLSVLV